MVNISADTLVNKKWWLISSTDFVQIFEKCEDLHPGAKLQGKLSIFKNN